MTLPLIPLERILKRAGAKRVSHEALEEFARVMEEKMLKIAEEAAVLAKHAGRKTVLVEDIQMTRRRV